MPKKETGLETEILDSWEELAFRDAHGPLSKEDLKSVTRSRQVEWQALLERAYSGDRWVVDVTVASTLSSSLWYERMILADYQGAENVAERFLAHVDFARVDKFPRVNWLIWRLLSKISQGDEDSAKQLAALVQTGPYRQGEMASLIYSPLSSFLGDLTRGDPVSDGLRILGMTLAQAKRASGKRIKACATAHNAGELIDALDWIFRRTP